MYRWLKVFEENRDPLSLRPRYSHRGGQGKVRIDPKIEEFITQTVNDVFKIREKRTVDDVWHEVAACIDGENQKRVLMPALFLLKRITKL